MELKDIDKTEVKWGELLTEYRLKRNLSRTSFALLLGVSRQTVRYWEVGEVAVPEYLTWELYKEEQEDHGE